MCYIYTKVNNNSTIYSNYPGNIKYQLEKLKKRK